MHRPQSREAASRLRMKRGIAACVARSRRWRTWIACATMLVFAWYALMPLPWVLLGAAPSVDRAARDATAAADHDHDDRSPPPRRIAAADIPGSPTHPEDHDCFECQVLKYLARCLLPGTVAPTVVALGAASVKPPAFPATRYAVFVSSRPPIRGPPLAGA